MLADTIGKDCLGYTSTDIDKDFWIKREVLPDEKEYYYILLVYVDDILCIYKHTLVVIDALTSIYFMRQGNMVLPDRYFGEEIEKMKNQDGNVMWANHRRYYCKAEFENLENNLTDDGKILSQYGDGRHPYPSRFHPDIYTYSELDENGVHEYQQHIGVLRWSIELVIIDIMTEVSCLAHHLCDSRVNN